MRYSGVPTQAVLFVDDGRLVTASTDIDQNCAELAEAWEITDRWMRTANLHPDVGKFECIHHSRARTKDENLPALKLHTRASGEVAIHLHST